MNTNEFIYARLSGAAGLTALVGTRISDTEAIQGCAFPYVTYMRVGGRRDYLHSGLESMAETLYQFDCVANTPNDAQAVARQVSIALDGGESPLVGFYCFLENERAFPPDSDTPKEHRIMIEAKIWFRQTTA